MSVDHRILVIKQNRRLLCRLSLTGPLAVSVTRQLPLPASHPSPRHRKRIIMKHSWKKVHLRLQARGVPCLAYNKKLLSQDNIKMNVSPSVNTHAESPEMVGGAGCSRSRSGSISGVLINTDSSAGTTVKETWYHERLRS